MHTINVYFYFSGDAQEKGNKSKHTLDLNNASVEQLMKNHNVYKSYFSWNYIVVLYLLFFNLNFISFSLLLIYYLLFCNINKYFYLYA